MLPKVTRLRWYADKSEEGLVKYCESLPYRIQIYSVAWNGKEWVMWFVPDDKAQILFPHGRRRQK